MITLLNSSSRIPNGILILTVGAMDGNTQTTHLELILFTLWNRGVKVWRRGRFPFSRITGKRRGGLGGGILPSPGVVSSVCNSVCQPLHRILGGGVRRTLKLGEGVVTPSRGSEREGFLLPRGYHVLDWSGQRDDMYSRGMVFIDDCMNTEACGDILRGKDGFHAPFCVYFSIFHEDEGIGVS